MSMELLRELQRLSGASVPLPYKNMMGDLSIEEPVSPIFQCPGAGDSRWRHPAGQRRRTKVQLAAMRSSGQGERYTVMINGKETFLYFERSPNLTGWNLDGNHSFINAQYSSQLQTWPLSIVFITALTVHFTTFL